MSLEEDSIAIIKQYEPQEGYYVAFSGGKDSIVMYDLIKRSGVKHDVHFSQTTVDPPEVHQFIKTHYPEVTWEKPKRSMFAAIRARQMPPTSKKRYCCGELKELHGIGRVVAIGIRAEESKNRAKRPVYGESKHNSKTFFLAPIHKWKETDIWNYIKKYKLPYPCLYDQGYTRIGCIMCPLQNSYGMILDAVRFPKYYNAYLRAFGVMLQNCKERGKENTEWKTPEDVMFWWIWRCHRKDAKNKKWRIPSDPDFNLEDCKPREYNRSGDIIRKLNKYMGR